MNTWSVLNLLAWTFGLYAVYALEGATWFTISGVLASILFTLRLPPVEARVHVPRQFAVAFTFAFAHSALAAPCQIGGCRFPAAARRS